MQVAGYVTCTVKSGFILFLHFHGDFSIIISLYTLNPTAKILENACTNIWICIYLGNKLEDKLNYKTRNSKVKRTYQKEKQFSIVMYSRITLFT